MDTEEHASNVIKLLRLKNESNIRHQRLDNNTRYSLILTQLHLLTRDLLQEDTIVSIFQFSHYPSTSSHIKS